MQNRQFRAVLLYSTDMTEYHNDLFGLAIRDYLAGRPHDLISWTSVSPPEIFRTAYLFRSFENMPVHERVALLMSEGKILDVGAGAGSHVLALQEAGSRVTALERSALAVKAMKKRGVNNILHTDFFEMPEHEKFDTLLFLMNGAGMVESLQRMPAFFKKIRSVLNKEGKALIHFSPVDYIYEMFGLTFPQERYYGEVMFYLKYKHLCQRPFPWIYFDRETFYRWAVEAGFHFEIVIEEEATGDYLAEMRPG